MIKNTKIFIMNNNVVITGGTEFIGGMFSAALSSGGFTPVIISRSQKGARQWEELGRILDGAAGIVNLAGENIASGLWTKERMKRIKESRINAGKRILAAIRGCAEKPGFLIQASAAGYYGNSGDDAVDESSPQGDTFLSEVCEAWEASTKQVEDIGVRRCVARFGIVLGQGGFLSKYTLPFKFFLGGPYGDGRQYVSWVHIDDAVRVLMKMAGDSAMNGIYNVTAPEPVTNNEFARVTAAAMRRTCFFRVPAFMLKAAAGRMAEELFLGGQRAVPERLLKRFFDFNFKNAGDAVDAVFIKKKN